MVVFNLLSLTPFNFDFNCDELHSRKIETLKKNVSLCESVILTCVFPSDYLTLLVALM